MPYKDRATRNEYFRGYMKERRREKKSPPSLPPVKQLTDLPKFLKEVSFCKDCEKNPSVFVFINEEKRGLCLTHWCILADSDVELGDEEKKELVEITSPLGALSYMFAS